MLNPPNNVKSGFMSSSKDLELRLDVNQHRSKRLKTAESTDGDNSKAVSGDEATIGTPGTEKGEIPDSDAESDVEETGRSLFQSTDLEATLPPIKTDKEAIEAYEAMRMVEQDHLESFKLDHGRRSWVRGKSSIYVDAFNLALETVLEEEKHLFDEKELEIFEQWRNLEYEAQYL